jgi:hypothetical protein
MIQPWRVLIVAVVSSAAFGVASATAQTVTARRVPAGEQVEVMLNGKPVGSATADAMGDASVVFNLQGSLGKSEIDANLYVDKCEKTHRVWIVEVGKPTPGEGTCDLRFVTGLYWVRTVNTIVVKDVTATAPSVLLLKGAYTPPPPGQEEAEAAPREAPGAGLVLFGGGGYGQTSDATAVACGDVQGCTGDESGIGLTGGAEYRFNRVLSAEVSYVRPSAVTASGEGATFRFDSEQNAHVFAIAGKVGVPIGVAKLYGRGGATYHQAKIVTNQTQDDRTVTVDEAPLTIPGGTQAFELKTDGWGWLFGGGLEVWFSPSFAIYGELDFTALKGDDVNGGEGKLDNRLGAVLVGLRVHIGK